MIVQAARRAAQDKTRADFLVADARRLCLRPSFDMAICLFDSLNYITDDGGLARCFHGVAAALRPRGLFIFDLNTIRALRLNLFDQTHAEPSDALEYDWGSSYDPETRLCRIRMEFRYKNEERDERFTEVHVQRGYEPKEIEAWLSDAGFECLHVYNAYTFRKVNAFANRAFFVARRARLDP